MYCSMHNFVALSLLMQFHFDLVSRHHFDIDLECFQVSIVPEEMKISNMSIVFIAYKCLTFIDY